LEYLNWVGAGLFVQLALVCYVLGLLTRNELLLRALLLVGTTFYIVYYYFIGDAPLWDAILASVAIGVANLSVLIAILRERSTLGMSAAMLELYLRFPTLNPGQFRKIIAHAKIEDLNEPRQLCEQGQPQTNLYLVADGSVTVRRDGQEFQVGAGNFIGEIAFLIATPATATVITNPGCRIATWDRARLEAFLAGRPEINHAFRAMINTDVARKLSLSLPQTAVQQASEPVQTKAS